MKIFVQVCRVYMSMIDWAAKFHLLQVKTLEMNPVC